jgi:Amidases related to nicotinamidase
VIKKILIVIDMQKDFIDGALGTKEAVGIVSNVTDKIATCNGDIYITKDTHHENYLATAEGKKLPVTHCIKDTSGWELDEQIKLALENREYIEFLKPTFGSIEMAEYIKKQITDNNIDVSCLDIELIGVCTDICVISNALLLKAYFPEAMIKVDSHCCAGVTPESSKNALEAMKMCQIEII